MQDATKKNDSLNTFHTKADPLSSSGAINDQTSEAAIHRLNHELEVHQIELEMQNAELRIARDQAELAMNKYSALFDFAPVGYFVVGSAGEILEVNLTGAELLGEKRESIKGKHIQSYVIQDQFEVATRFLAQLFESDSLPPYRKRSIELRMNPVREMIREVLAEAVAFEDGEKCLITLIDITQKNRNELQLKQYSEELRAANEAKDQFFTIIAHDLRAPFNVFLGVSDYLMNEYDTMPPQKAKYFLKGLNDSLHAQYQLLTNLLDWSRLNKESFNLNYQSLNVCQVVDEIIKSLVLVSSQKQIELVNQLPEEFGVIADHNMLKLVLRNLITNAIKFSYQKGSVEIYGRSFPGYVEISISDHGVGISQDAIKGLFSQVRKHSTAGTQGEKGTGLGLLLCHLIVSKHGGTIRVESTPDIITTFSFTLPDHNEPPHRNAE